MRYQQDHHLQDERHAARHRSDRGVCELRGHVERVDEEELDARREAVLRDEIVAERAGVVGRAREGGLRREDIEGGTFTISNLGMFGLDQFTAVLNPPQAAILAVGATSERAVVRDGESVARPTMTMTLTCDHRSVDGATASEFLRTVKEFLEEPGLAL